MLGPDRAMSSVDELSGVWCRAMQLARPAALPLSPSLQTRICMLQLENRNAANVRWEACGCGEHYPM